MATGSDGPIGPSHVIVATKSAGCGMGSSSKVALLEAIGELAGFALADEVGVGRLGSGELVAIGVAGRRGARTLRRGQCRWRPSGASADREHHDRAYERSASTCSDST